MGNEKGTPKTLMDACKLGVATARSPIIDAPVWLHNIIKDFLAQRFGAAILEAENAGNKDEADRLHNLFNQITK